MIGNLNKRITLQYVTQTADGMGGFSETWADDAEVWAAIWPKSASEQIQSMQAVMTISHRIRIRYRSTLKPSWRINFGTRYFNIIEIINPNERGEWSDIMCKEIV